MINFILTLLVFIEGYNIILIITNKFSRKITLILGKKIFSTLD